MPGALHRDRSASGWVWFWSGLGFVAAALAFLELLDPYFFCQDDALSLELPVVLMSCRAVWSGMLPQYNPFIFLGSPSPVAGGFYPPIFIAYGIARHLLGNEYATFDVFAALNLPVGYCLTFVLARRLGIGPVLAAVASLTFVLSGPVIVMARCWHSFTVLAVFIPLFALFADRLRNGPVTWRWPVGLGVALGTYYHSGFPQLFVLGCGLLLIHAAALAALGFVPRRRLLWLAPALAFGAAIAIPVFHQQWRLSREMSLEDPGGGSGVGSNLLAMLLPYPFVQGTLPNDWGSRNLEWGGHLYYFGSVLLIAFLAAVVSSGRRLFATRQPAAEADSARLQLALAAPAIVALLLALGESGGLWWLMGLLPVGLRNNPFRALPWFVFFACLAGARHLEDLLGHLGGPERAAVDPTAERRRARWLAAVAGGSVLLVALHLTRVGIAFFVYGFQPYPELPAELANLIRPDDTGRQQRIMTFAAMRTTDPSYPLVLPHNLPCEYGVPAFFGYDPLVQRFGRYASCLDRVMTQPQAALAAYGVRWLLVHRTGWGGWKPQTPNRFERVLPFLGLLQTLGTNRQENLGELDQFVAALEIPDAAPLAFDLSRPADALPLRMNATGLEITVEPTDEPRRVVANFLRYPDIVATADGRPAPVTEDEWQRIVVDAAAGARVIRIAYRPPRAAGYMAAAFLALAGAVSLFAAKKLAA